MRGVHFASGGMALIKQSLRLQQFGVVKVKGGDYQRFAYIISSLMEFIYNLYIYVMHT